VLGTAFYFFLCPFGAILFCSVLFWPKRVFQWEKLAQTGLSVGKTGPNGPFSGKNWPNRVFQWEKLAQPGLSVGKTGPTGSFSGKNWPNRVFQWENLAQPGLSVALVRVDINTLARVDINTPVS
jgi:hypothetical protein